MDLKSVIADYPGFPKEGVTFRDFSPLLRDPAAVSHVLDEFSARFPPDSFDVLAGIESRGFPLAAAMAVRHGKGMMMVRKAGKLPGETERASYTIEYGSDTMEVQRGAAEGQRVLVCDDLLATGGTARASAGLIERTGGSVRGFAFIIEIPGLGGAARLEGYEVASLAKY